MKLIAAIEASSTGRAIRPTAQPGEPGHATGKVDEQGLTIGNYHLVRKGGGHAGPLNFDYWSNVDDWEPSEPRSAVDLLARLGK